jgi:putative tricarboxylic transport membrane protein
MLGIQVALSFQNLFYCFIGVFLGTVVGVLPGLGPSATIALLLSLTYRMDMTAAVIMLAGIYYGAMYGGSITSILVNIPGEAASVVTCIDGHEMAKRGRGGQALGISAFGSFIAGTFGVVGIMFLAPALSELAMIFGSPEYVMLMVMGMSLVTYLSGGSKIKALMMGALGLILGCIGMDPMSGHFRFSFGIVTLTNGLDIPILAMGLFGIAEILINAEKEEGAMSIIQTSTKLRDLLPDWTDWKRSMGPILRGTGMGFFLGVLPGGGAIIASFASYAYERKQSKHPEEFGKGAIEGVAGPESANNAASAGAFVPLLTLGIPANAVMALIMAAFMIHGVNPGPMIIKDRPEVFWGVVFSMYVGNIFLIILNVPLIKWFIQLLKVPTFIMYPLILMICFIGAFSNSNNVDDMFIVGILGIVGYILKKYEYDPAPLVLAFVLGPILERTLRQALVISDGHPAIFLTRPVSRIMVILTIILWISPLLLNLARKLRGREN